MDAPPPEEDIRPFITIARHLKSRGINAPDILAEDQEGGFLLLEDFGDARFNRLLKNNYTLEKEEKLYKAAIDVLLRLHTYPAFDAVPDYDDLTLLHEAMLLPEWYLPFIHEKPADDAAKEEFAALWQPLFKHTRLNPNVLVLRDYHADNLMWMTSRKGLDQVGVLDFQDALNGSPAYDIVSLLEDARRDVAPEFAEAMIQYYLQHMASIDEEAFRLSYTLLGAQRNMKIVGIFARLALRDSKFQYLHYLPRVWRYLEQDLQHPMLKPLKSWIDNHIPKEVRHITPTRPKKGLHYGQH